MAANGRPTPQLRGVERPGFIDRLPDFLSRPDLNPYTKLHRTFGRPLLPADEAWRYRGRWHELFQRTAPLHLEIGTGNGFFLAALAKTKPEINLVGIEIRYKRSVLTARKLRVAGATHAVIARYHAAYLDDLFETGELSGIYVNHPDPWPRVKHVKHRLVSRWFMEDVARLLKPGGRFRMKSDFLPNIERAEEVIDGLPLSVVGRCLDVTGSDAPWADDIETNYQSKFRKRGLPVAAIELLRS